MRKTERAPNGSLTCSSGALAFGGLDRLLHRRLRTQGLQLGPDGPRQGQPFFSNNDIAFNRYSSPFMVMATLAAAVTVMLFRDDSKTLLAKEMDSANFGSSDGDSNLNSLAAAPAAVNNW